MFLRAQINPTEKVTIGKKQTYTFDPHRMIVLKVDTHKLALHIYIDYRLQQTWRAANIL